MLMLRTISILSLDRRSWEDCVCPEDIFSSNKSLLSSAVERYFSMPSVSSSLPQPQKEIDQRLLFLFDWWKLSAKEIKEFAQSDTLTLF